MDRALNVRAPGFPASGLRTHTATRSILFTGVIAAAVLRGGMAWADEGDADGGGTLAANSAVMVPAAQGDQDGQGDGATGPESDGTAPGAQEAQEQRLRNAARTDSAPGEAAILPGADAPLRDAPLKDVNEAAIASATAASEERGLGMPNAMFSSRPVETEDAGLSNPLAALDPRKNDLVRVFLALGAVVVLLLGVRSMMRRGGGLLAGAGRPSGVVQVLARYPVARGQQLMLIELGRRIVLVHQGSGGVSTISEVTDADEVADLRRRIDAGSTRRREAGFGSILRRFERDHDEEAQATAGLAAMSGGDESIVDLTRRGRAGRRGRGQAA